MNVQRELTLKNDAAMAAQVSAAVLTMHELIEIAERARGPCGGA